MENIEDITKTTTKQYFACITCKQKMESIEISKNSSFDFFGTMTPSGKAMYCNSKECDKFGYLTVAGIKKEE